MASSTTKSPLIVKTEPKEGGFQDTSYERYGTPMTSSPTGVDSTTLSVDNVTSQSDPSAQLTAIESELRAAIQTKPKGKIPRGVNNENLNPRKRPSSDAHCPIKSSRVGNSQSSSFEHKVTNHPIDLLHAMREMRKSGKLIDMAIVVEGREIHCHKVVVCGVSGFFMDKVAANRTHERIHTTDTSFETMSALVDFCYSCRITITDDNIEELLSASSILRFNAVKSACLNFLREKVNSENCLAIELFATEHGFTELADDAIKFAYRNFQSLINTKDFFNLGIERVAAIISNDAVVVDSEEIVYTAAMDWIKYDKANRERFLNDVLEKIRFPLLKPQFLLDVVQNEPLVKNNKSFDPLLDEARRFHLLVDQRPLMQSKRTLPRSGYNIKESDVLVVVGGLDRNKRQVSECFYYRFPDVCGREIAPLNVEQTAYSVAAANNNIFVTGGAAAHATAEVRMYVPSLNKWQKVESMNTARYLHASVGFCGKLYVMGGHNGQQRLKSMERYDPDTNKWKMLRPMLDAISSPSASARDHYIYVIGGAKGPSPADIVASVQQYDINSDSWTHIAALPQPERGAVAANLNGTIFVIGQNKKVYAYSSKSKKWNTMNDTNAGHIHGAATVHNGRLYVSGGLHGNSYINGTIEVYDQLTDQWAVVGTLLSPIYAQGFVNITKHVKS